jgi:16S rRNA (guanine527-N7)-methyltransferase
MINTEAKQLFDLYYPDSNVSRETLERLTEFKNLLIKWNQKINLIGKESINEVWLRHIIDSAQLLKFISKENIICDLGSGAGFPGIVLSLCGVGNISLVESDRRKSIFLTEAAKLTNNTLNIINERVEKLNGIKANVITARGFAALAEIFSLCENILRENSRLKLVLLKGKTIKDEIDKALKGWSFDYKLYPSISNQDGSVIVISNVNAINPK